MDITGTKKKIERAIKVAEQSYKKMNELLERVQGMERDLETTSEQVDWMEREMAEQRVLLEAIATEQGIDAEAVLEEADLPDRVEAGDTAESDETDTEAATKATSRPSTADED